MEFLNLVLGSQVAVAALVCMSYLLLWSWGGMLSFGHALLVGTGAYAAYAGYIVYGQLLFHYPTLLALNGIVLAPVMLCAGLFAGLLMGGLVGLLAGRWGGTPFAMITLALAELGGHIALSLPQYFGDEGGFSIDRGLFWSQGLRLEWLSWLVVLMVALGIYFLGRGHWALRLHAVQGNPERYAHMGGSPLAMRCGALMLSGAIAGLAGAAMLLQLEHISHHVFAADKSANYLVYAYLGLLVWSALIQVGQQKNQKSNQQSLENRTKFGKTLLAAALCGAFLMVMGQTVLSRFTPYWGLLLGVMVMLAVWIGRERQMQ